MSISLKEQRPLGSDEIIGDYLDAILSAPIAALVVRNRFQLRDNACVQSSLLEVASRIVVYLKRSNAS